MILHLGVNLGIVSLSADIPLHTPLYKTKVKDNIKEYTKIREYDFCFCLAQTGCVAEYAKVKTSIKEVNEKINNIDCVNRITDFGLMRPQIKKLFDSEQIISEIKESNGFDGIDVKDFDLIVYFNLLN